MRTGILAIVLACLFLASNVPANDKTKHGGQPDTCSEAHKEHAVGPSPTLNDSPSNDLYQRSNTEPNNSDSKQRGTPLSFSDRISAVLSRPSLTDYLISLFTFVLTIVTIWQGALAKLALRQSVRAADAAHTAADAAHKQSDIAVDELHRSHRPWLRPSNFGDIRARMLFDTDGATLFVDLELKNAGTSPAFKANWIHALKIGPSPTPDPLIYQTRVQRVSFNKVGGNWGKIVLPGDSIPYEIKVLASKSAFPSDNPDLVTIWFNGNISYEDEFGVPHSTTFLYRFVENDGALDIRPRGRVNGKLRAMGFGWFAD